MTTLLSICFIPSFACVSRVVYSTERGKKINDSSSSENPLGNYIRLKESKNRTHTDERKNGAILLFSAWLCYICVLNLYLSLGVCWYGQVHE